MSPSSISLVKDLCINDVVYDEPRKLENGGKMVYVSLKKNPIRIQTPLCSAPFGINVYKNEDQNTESHTLDISFDGKDGNPNLKDFFDKMKSFDEQNVSKGFDYQQAWFRKKYPSKEVIDALYTSIIKYPKDKNGDISKDWSPTFKIKLPFVNGEYKFEMYDKSNTLIDPKTVQTKGAKVIAIIKCNGIWIAGGKFGMSWKAEQIQIIPPNRISGFCIRYVEDDMIDIVDTKEKKKNVDKKVILAVDKKTTATPQVNDTLVELSSDDEDELDSEEDDVVEVVPVVVEEEQEVVPVVVEDVPVVEEDIEPEVIAPPVVKKRVIKKKV